jgi:hypothetical protein
MVKSPAMVSRCKKCGSKVYYTPQLYLKMRSAELLDNDLSRFVDLECEGDEKGNIHTFSYEFPDEFREI